MTGARRVIVETKFDEASFDFTVHCLTNEPAFLGRTIVVITHTRAAFIGGDDRLLERTFGEPVKVAAKDGLEVQPITALK
jgi:ABC-type siderophore export system fused ATPase/permease subunit